MVAESEALADFLLTVRPATLVDAAVQLGALFDAMSEFIDCDLPIAWGRRRSAGGEDEYIPVRGRTHRCDSMRSSRG